MQKDKMNILITLNAYYWTYFYIISSIKVCKYQKYFLSLQLSQ